MANFLISYDCENQIWLNWKTQSGKEKLYYNDLK